MTTTYIGTMQSPVGELLLASNGSALTAVQFDGKRPRRAVQEGRLEDDAVITRAKAALDAYFSGELVHFDLDVAMTGTPFQVKVWRALREVPFGETESYGELARRIGAAGAQRAVGAANGQNPVAIVVPCHRVIGANGALTGFGGGLPRKTWLLEHEARVAARLRGRPRPVQTAFPDIRQGGAA